MNKFQMIAEEMKKKGFRPLPKGVVANSEFETMIRKDFRLKEREEKIFYRIEIEIESGRKIRTDVVDYYTSYDIMTNESQWCA